MVCVLVSVILIGRGAFTQSADGAPPGGFQATEIRILSTNTGGGYGWGSGTSQAAAHVPWAITRALQLRPELSSAQVCSGLQTTDTDLGYPQTQQGA
jgi:Subtilase family